MKVLANYSPKIKILSLILTFLIVFYLVPASVYAEGLDTDTAVAENPMSENEEASTYTPPIYEVTELRETNVKHFRLENGSYIAAQYNYPVHYTDENDKLIDIDNRLIESSSEFSTSNSRVKFIKKITGNGNIFTLHENNTKITVGLVGAEKKTNGVVTSTHNSDDDIEDTLGKLTNLENLSSTILYENILDGVDIEYVVHSLNIKENIIVKERKNNYSYTFTIELNNLTATLAEDGNVYINTYDGKTKYIIPAPVVFDANEVLAPDRVSEYTLNTVGNKKYELTVTVSSDWMNASERVFPVTIDPAMLSPGGNVLDLSIDSSSPDSNQNNAFAFYVSSTQRAYLKFDENYFTPLPVGTSIMKAELSLKGGIIGTSPSKIGVYPIVSDWNDTITWNKTIATEPEGSFGANPLDYTTVGTGVTRYSWDITKLYKAWMAGEANYGVGLKPVDQSTVLVHFLSYEGQDSSDFRKPVIMVTYIHNDGLENYYPTETHSAGAGGVGSINLATGKLTLVIPTLTTTDSLFAFTLTLVYNSSLAGKDVTSEHVDIPFATSYMPKGFKLNIQETIVEKEYCDENNANHTYYSFYDADGTTHHFFSDGSNEYYDDSGLRLTLTFSNGEALIEDTSKTIRTYSALSDTAWHLTSITDKYGNQLVFHFNDFYQPDKIFVKPNGLEEIEMLSLLYENGKLIAVYNNASKDSVIFEYSSGNLSMVRYCFGNDNTTEQNIRDAYADFENAVNVESYASARYNFNLDGYISGVEDIEAKKYTWYLTAGGKTVHITEYSDNFHGQEVSYTYGDGYTDVRSVGNDENLDTADDIITRYIFDQHNRAVSVYSMSADGTEIYGATMGIYETIAKAKNNLKETAVVYDDNANYLPNDNGNYYATLQGGIDKTAETGCYKQTVFEEENIESTSYNANKEYVISGFGYSNSILQNENAKFSLSVNVYYYQGEGIEDIVVTYDYDFMDVENTWQFVSGKLDCKIGSTTSSEYDVVRKIELVCNYYGQVDVDNSASYAYFKDISFTDISSFSSYRYKYDATTGNLVTKSNYSYSEYYEYNDKNNITRVANNKGEIYDYEYDTDGVMLVREKYCEFNRIGSFQGQLLYDYPFGETDIDSKLRIGIINQTEYTYTDQGLVESTRYYGESETTGGVFTTSYTYVEIEQSPIFGALLTETDTLGHQTKYFYDDSNGELLAQIDVDSGNGYVYDYSDSGELQAVYPATGTLTEYTKTTNAENVNYEYDSNTHRLSKIITDSTEYSFSYNLYGNSSGVTVGNDTLATYEYYPNNGKLKKINYGNGFSEEYVYNTLEMLSEVWYTYSDGSRVKAYGYEYNKDGSLAKFTNYLDGTYIEYEYDVHGRLISSDEIDPSDTDYKNEYAIETFDAEGRIRKSHNYVSYLSSSGLATVDLDKWYEFNTNGTLHRETLGYASTDSLAIYYYYDDFGRLTRAYRRADDVIIDSTYTYVSDESNTSYRVASVNNLISGEHGSIDNFYQYTYDSKGNITRVVYNVNTTTNYYYDDIGQLTRESGGKTTYDYTYDDAGNITSITETTLNENAGIVPRPFIVTDPLLPPQFPLYITETTTFSYTDSEWGDLLTSYKGISITYDEIGNPLTYYNGSSYTFTWTGRQLSTAVNGSKTMSFTYNDEGIRTSKTVNGVTHTYYLNGSQIMAEEWEDKLLVYLYDASGSPIGMMYRTTSYEIDEWNVFWFEKNLQGDIVAVYNRMGLELVTYSYDAWGNQTVKYWNGGGTSPAQYNPFRYRGYYYDTDLRMYYLQSRYYDSKICRFINADSIIDQTSALGYNLFSYCRNNPVNMIDTTGNLPFFVITAAIGAVIGAVTGGIIAANSGENIWAGIGIGAAVGGLAGAGLGAAAGAMLTGSATATAEAVLSAAGILATTAAPMVQQAEEKASTILQTYYPPNDGFIGTIQKITLEAGTLVQRVGNLDGYFIAPANTPTQMLSLPYDKVGQPITILQVQQSVEVFAGRVAPWFGQIGGGTQYKLEIRLAQLISEGVINIFGE